MGLAAFGIVLLVVTLALPLLAGASDYHTGDDLRFGRGEAFAGNVYIAARRVTFDATTAKDVTLTAANAHINGRVGGNLSLLAGSTTIRGDIGGSVHVAGGNVDVRGTIEGDLLVAGGNVHLASASTVRGDVIALGGIVNVAGTVEGRIYGSVLRYAQRGSVGGDIDLQASGIDLRSSARVGGDLRYQSSQEADIAQPTAVAGEVVRTNATPWLGVGDGALRSFGLLMRTAWALILGATIIALMPRLATRIAEHAEPFLQPVVLGVIAFIAIPLIAMLALVTIVGIPLGVLLLMGLALGLYLSQVFVGLTLGRYVLPRSWRDGSRGFSLLAMTLGVIAINALRMVPLPYVGAIVALVVALWGLGASLQLIGDLTARKTRLHTPGA